MGKFSPPDPFDFGKPQLWPDWKQRWLRYHTATELGKKAQDVQISSLIYAIARRRNVCIIPSSKELPLKPMQLFWNSSITTSFRVST